MKLCRIDGCEKKVNARGYCGMHYKRLKIYGDPLTVHKVQHHGLSLADRFMKYVGDRPSEKEWAKCWEWTGAKDHHGYGRLSSPEGHVSAHRLSWEIFVGPIPEGINVLHVCDNTGCVRPKHLFLGTQKDNSRDMVLKGRCKSRGNPGEGHGCAKWKNEDILNIRSDHAGGLSYAAIMGKYGMSKSQVARIVTRKSWRHI